MFHISLFSVFWWAQPCFLEGLEPILQGGPPKVEVALVTPNENY